MAPPTRWWYRVGHFSRAVGARPSPRALRVADALLSPAERSLFDGTSPRDQHHHLETLRLLPGSVRGNRTIARAALLHDVGKGWIRLHERVLFVLLNAAFPGLLDRIAHRDRPGLLGALYRIHHHAGLGADALSALGVEPRLVDLVRRHHDDPAGDPDLYALIHADDRA